MDRSNDNTDMAFISPNVAKHDIQFQVGDDLGSDHLPIEVSIDAPPHRNSSTNHTKYKFDQTDREVFESIQYTRGCARFRGHFLDLCPPVTLISTLTLSYLQLAL